MSSTESRDPANRVKPRFESKRRSVSTYNPVDDGKHQDGVVFAQVLISDDCTPVDVVLAYQHQAYGEVHCLLQNGCDIAEELEEHVETSGASVSKTKTWRSIASVGFVVDVVLEESLASVVFGNCQ
jgi:hypothetical protein